MSPYGSRIILSFGRINPILSTKLSSIFDRLKCLLRTWRLYFSLFRFSLQGILAFDDDSVLVPLSINTSFLAHTRSMSIRLQRTRSAYAR